MSPRTSPPDHCLCCHGAAAPVQEVLRAILANRGFLVQFKEGAQLRGMAAVARRHSVFLHGGFGPFEQPSDPVQMQRRGSIRLVIDAGQGAFYRPRRRLSSASSSATRLSAAIRPACSSSVRLSATPARASALMWAVSSSRAWVSASSWDRR